ncbi:MAG: MATE family efflux transporter [Treponema sp.]|jgi:putative MATE family efflux protein|nr:MATE family efflux transporter [Treponema sp.]
MTKNLTIGSPAALILSFTIPLLIGNLFQQFYNMADALIVGRTISYNALAAVGCTGSIVFFILGFVFGFTQGTSIITAQRFGAGDEARVKQSFAANIVLAGGLTVIMTLVGGFLARPMLLLLRTPPEILEDAAGYLSIIFWGIAAAVLFNLCSNIMRAVGDSRTPLIFLVIACLVNIALDFAFILLFGLGVRGAAYATVFAQVIAGVSCLPVIRAKMPVLRIRAADLRVSRAECIAHLKVALPMGFQMSIIAIGVIAMQFALNGLGVAAVAAVTAAQKIDMVATMPLNSFGATMATYTAQNYGAGKIARIRKGMIQCFIMSGSFSVVMGIVFVFTGRALSSIFITGNPEAIDLSYRYLVLNGAFYIVLALLFICRNSLQGLGNALVPTIAGVMELVMRMLGAVLLSASLGFLGICLASPLAWIGAAVPMAIAVTLAVKKLHRGGGG